MHTDTPQAIIFVLMLVLGIHFVYTAIRFYWKR